MTNDPRMTTAAYPRDYRGAENGPMVEVDVRPIECALKETTLAIDTAHDVLSDLEARLMAVMTPEPISKGDAPGQPEPPRSAVREAITNHGMSVARLVDRMRSIKNRLEI